MKETLSTTVWNTNFEIDANSGTILEWSEERD